jgi:hypothetical protein
MTLGVPRQAPLTLCNPSHSQIFNNEKMPT